MLILHSLSCLVAGNVSVSYFVSVCHGKTRAMKDWMLGQLECMTFVFTCFGLENVKYHFKYSNFGSSVLGLVEPKAETKHMSWQVHFSTPGKLGRTLTLLQMRSLRGKRQLSIIP